MSLAPRRGFCFCTFPPQMRRDARHGSRHGGGVIPTEQGLHFRKDGDRWRCVEWPGLTMLPGDRYEVDGREFDSLTKALAKTEPSAVRLPEAWRGRCGAAAGALDLGGPWPRLRFR